MFLTDAELIELTHRQYAAWQARALDAMKIPYRKRPDGTLVVLREDLGRPHDSRPAPRLRAG